MIFSSHPYFIKKNHFWSTRIFTDVPKTIWQKLERHRAEDAPALNLNNCFVIFIYKSLQVIFYGISQDHVVLYIFS